MIAADIGAALANASRLGSHADLIFRALENRAALVALEFEETRQRLQAAVLWALISTAALLWTGVTITFIVAAVFWDTPHRVLALSILALLQIGLGAAGVWYVMSRWQRWQLLEHSRDQLTKDAACLREILVRNPR